MPKILSFNKKKLSIQKAHDEQQESIKKLEFSKLRGELDKVNTWIISLNEVTHFCLMDDFTPPGMLEGHKLKIRERRDIILSKLHELDGE